MTNIIGVIVMYQKSRACKSDKPVMSNMKRVAVLFAALTVIAAIAVVALDGYIGDGGVYEYGYIESAPGYVSDIGGYVSDEYVASYASYGLAGYEDSNSYTEGEQPTSYTGGGTTLTIYTMRIM